MQFNNKSSFDNQHYLNYTFDLKEIYKDHGLDLNQTVPKQGQRILFYIPMGKIIRWPSISQIYRIFTWSATKKEKEATYLNVARAASNFGGNLTTYIEKEFLDGKCSKN